MSTDEPRTAIEQAYDAASGLLEQEEVEAVLACALAAVALVMAGDEAAARTILTDPELSDGRRPELAAALARVAELCGDPTPAEYVIWSNQQQMWWGPGENGYTRYVEEAGRYSETDARRIVAQATVAGQLVHRVPSHLTYADVEVLDEWMLSAPVPVVRACRVCGCTEDRACEGGCSWAEPDLCSACRSTP